MNRNIVIEMNENALRRKKIKTRKCTQVAQIAVF